MPELHILKYKTRGGVNPKGLPRIYFCAHERDFSAFFASISDELLAKQNCAVWYDDGEGEAVDLETRELDLSQMNLFVMPITERLLRDEICRAMEEFRYAVEHHIPVLPLMQESGLEMLFNEKCGDLQFLDKHKRDETAISYDEKLETYLSSVLVGDELDTKIRSEFYAYIFLSYRKKDRKYAQKLMQLIHKDDRFCDIAIWYDEFLTPGENFNDAIAEALDKSRLVALVVTPSLLEDPNYVMTVEYPMAKKAGKPILPVEMMKTPHFRMKRKYKGICVPLAPDAIWKKLWYSQLVERTSYLWHESDPQHNFLIGLAYLSGIDVEKDNTRALALITIAANAGLPEAAEKLVSMYQSGIGVFRNYDTALLWQRKLVEIRRAAYEKEPNAETAAAYTLEFSNLGSDLWALRRTAEAEEVLKSLEEEGTRIAERIDSYRVKQSVAKATNLLAEICDARGDFIGAEAYYRKTLAMREAYFEEYAREKGRSEAQRFLLFGYYNIGGNYFSRRDFETAETYYRKVKDDAEAFYREEQNDDTAEALSLACDAMGSLYEVRGDIVAAEEHFRRSMTLMESVKGAARVPRLRSNLAYAYGRHGRILCYFQKFEEAASDYRKSIAIFEELASETKTIEHRIKSAGAFVDLGIVLTNDGKVTEA
ncbi:MAG: TIR domain-containing protein, partial [Clostridia bacterium]|nr:TIR domain-containing protein [Clostridia bacterium]